METISRRTTTFLLSSHVTESLVLSIWGSEGCAGAGRSRAHLAVQIFQVPFAQALVAVLPRNAEEGHFVISEPFTPRGSREGTGILIRGVAWGWGGATLSLLSFP